MHFRSVSRPETDRLAFLQMLTGRPTDRLTILAAEKPVCRPETDRLASLGTLQETDRNRSPPPLKVWSGAREYM